jgi:pimeloyl-ACP methyl ester carboxylesterase
MNMFSMQRAWFVGACAAFATIQLVHEPVQVFGQAAKKPTIPKVQSIPIDANGLTIQCAYFPGGFVQKTETEIVAKPGKEVVPIILLHGLEGRGADLSALAQALQKQGHAVMVPDLRGHGASNKIKLPSGVEKEVEPAKLGRNDFVSMRDDVEGIKRFLYEQNNQGIVNIELLCLMGADLGGLVATNWIADDWSRRDLPAFKQGKSAKALVMISPIASIKGYNASTAWKHPVFQSNIMSIMLIAGKRDTKSYNEAKQMFNRIERHHAVPEDPAERVTKQSLFLIEPDTELRGTKLVDPRAGLPTIQSILQFVTLRLVNRKDEFPWAERKNPLGDK